MSDSIASTTTSHSASPASESASISHASACSQLASGTFGNRFDAGVLDLAFHRDRVERLAHRIGLADQLDAVLALHLIGNHARADENPAAGLAERLHQGAVIEFPDNPWLNLLLGEPALQTAAHNGFRAGDQ